MFFVALALLPAMLLMIWLYTRDRIHPEPKRAVYRVFLLGAAIVLPAGLLERVMLESGFNQHKGTFGGILITAFFVAGMVEEFLKAAIVERAAVQTGLIKAPLDSIIYSGACALGFATVENVLYVTSSGFSTALLRSVTAVPAHLMFGILMGVFFTNSMTHRHSRAWAYIVPALAHGVYDTFALSNTWLGDVLLFIYLIILLEITLRSIDKVSHLPRTQMPFRI
jgi:RsiW-degrading membrane proteinase PrsW (M82 family)